MSKPFKIPVSGESTKIDNVELIPEGFQLCTFVGLVDVGTHSTNFGDKRQIKLSFEFPQHMRKYYEDKDLQPAMITNTETYSLAEKSNLRKMLHSMHKPMTDEEASQFDFSSLLGKYFIANITHNYSQKHQKTFANTSTISKLDDRMAQFFGVDKNVVSVINEIQIFSIDNDGFDSDAFANLHNWLKNEIKNSSEGKAYAASGGIFREQATGMTNGVPNQSLQQAFEKDPLAIKYGVIMLNKDYTLQEMLDAGWSIDLLIKEGYAKKAQPTAPPVTAAPAPNTISKLQAPSPATVSTPTLTPQSEVKQPTAVPQPIPSKPVGNPLYDGLIVKDNGDIAAWLNAGWTVEMMLAEGHAWYLNPDGTKSDVPF